MSICDFFITNKNQNNCIKSCFFNILRKWLIFLHFQKLVDINQSMEDLGKADGSIIIFGEGGEGENHLCKD